MNTSKSLNEDIRFIKDTPSDDLYNNHLKLVFTTYQKLFGEVCTGCPTRIAGYINRIKKQNTDKVMEKSTSNFLLKKGGLIVIRGTSKAYSNANLTDEIAIDFIKKNPNRKALFIKLPKNLEDLLNGSGTDGSKDNSDKETVAQLKKKGREELNAIALELGLDASSYGNKTEISEAIMAKRAETEEGKDKTDPSKFNEYGTPIYTLETPAEELNAIALELGIEEGLSAEEILKALYPEE